jgi:periplasmic protein CpxP/Spy
MKKFFKAGLLATALATALVGTSAMVMAQGMGGLGGMGGMHGQAGAEGGPGQHGARHAQRMDNMQKQRTEHQAQLKAALQLSAAQEPAWNAFVAGTAHSPRAKPAAREDNAALTTPERLDKMLAQKAERDAQMAQHVEATKSFYATLTPEQKKVFDAQAHPGMQRASMKGGHGHGQGMRGEGCDGGMKKQG